MGPFFETPDSSATADGSDKHHDKHRPEGLRYSASDVSRRRTMSSANCDACTRTRSRSPGNLRSLTRLPASSATAAYTRPTGLSEPSADGPAMPVTDTPMLE